MDSLLPSTVLPFLVDAMPFIACAGFIFAVLALVAITLLERRLEKMLATKGSSVEETLTALRSEMKDVQAFRTELEAYLNVAEMRVRGSVQGVGMVRFNPFSGDGSGGNQSFSLALLNEFGGGAVISALYARDRVSIYCKPLESGKSEFELTKEELDAIAKAKKQISDHKKK